MRLAIDFDGTIVKHKFPEIGEPVPYALTFLHAWQGFDIEMILWTMRSNGKSRNYLTEAVDFCKSRGIYFNTANEGLGDREWTTSPKVWADWYIDDMAFGCPLIKPKDGSRPYVDWLKVGPAITRLIEEEHELRASSLPQSLQPAGRSESNPGLGEEDQGTGNAGPGVN